MCRSGPSESAFKKIFNLQCIRCWWCNWTLSSFSLWVVAIQLLGWCVYVCSGQGHVHAAAMDADTLTYAHSHRKTTETLLILPNRGSSIWVVAAHPVCEVNTFPTFLNFPKKPFQAFSAGVFLPLNSAAPLSLSIWVSGGFMSVLMFLKHSILQRAE